jgi:hypothetical protein
MEKASGMTPQEKKVYIFAPRDGLGFNWIEQDLLGDIQTFVDGVERYIQDRSSPDGIPRGSGNLSLPILVCTALELVSALFTGKTVATNNTDNVEKFIKKYYPDPYKEIPRIFWDGIRNGVVYANH